MDKTGEIPYEEMNALQVRRVLYVHISSHTNLPRVELFHEARPKMLHEGHVLPRHQPRYYRQGI